jgi:O-antigen biosynthesis protein
MKRAVYEKVGGLGERFGIGFFDDDDLAERARRAGFELAVTHDLFVHHFGSRTFAGNGIDAGKVLNDNARRFADKWGLAGTNGKRVSLRPWTGPTQCHTEALRVHYAETEAGAPLVRQAFQADAVFHDVQQPDVRLESLTYDRARVSLTIIARDEENNLPTCLESVRGIFDEIIVVDPGSNDRTAEIARSFGAQVFQFTCVDDFSAPRDEALSHATGDYAFWPDADDVVDPAEAENLRALLACLKRPLQSTTFIST